MEGRREGQRDRGGMLLFLMDPESTKPRYIGKVGISILSVSVFSGTSLHYVIQVGLELRSSGWWGNPCLLVSSF